MKITATVLALAVALPTIGSAVEGRYQTVIAGKGGIVWVTDTKTGKTRICYSKGDTTAPTCSPWSED